MVTLQQKEDVARWRILEDSIRENWDIVQRGQSLQQHFTPSRLVRSILEQIGSLKGKDVLVVANSEILLYLTNLKHHPKFNGNDDFNYKSLTLLTDSTYLEGKRGDDWKVVVEKFNNVTKIDMGMKFDVVIGNPPFQAETGASTSAPIWHKFVDFALDVANDAGTVALIHPNGWRKGKRTFNSISNRMRSLQFKYVKLSNYQTGKELFDVNTTADWYVLENTPILKGTVVSDIKGSIHTLNLNSISILPDIIPDSNAVDLTNEHTVNVVYNTAYHTQKAWVTNEKTENSRYPVVYTLKQDGPSLKYTNDRSHGHFGVPKIVLGRGKGKPVLDLTGEYGATEFAYYITAESCDVLQKMYDALLTDECISLLRDLGSGDAHNYLKEAVSLLHKDFWREFV